MTFEAYSKEEIDSLLSSTYSKSEVDKIIASVNARLLALAPEPPVDPDPVPVPEPEPVPTNSAAVPLRLAKPVLVTAGTTITASWKPASAPISHYTLRVRPVGGSWVIFPGSLVSPVVITAPNDMTVYEVSVRPSNAVGNGEWSPSETIAVGTSGPPPVTNPGDPVLWRDKFAAATVGQLSKVSGDNLFGPTVRATDNATYARVSIADDPSGKLLRNSMPANDYGTYINTPKLARETDHATLEYQIRFSPNFDWQWGGKMGPGLVGVRPGLDILGPSSGNPDRSVGFSTRLMWHGNNTNGTGTGRPFSAKLPAIAPGANDIVTYIYAPAPGPTNPLGGPTFNNTGWHTSLGAMSKGEWHTIKMEVKLNTVGQANGVFRVWIDGQLRYQASNWIYRATADIAIQAILWDIHRGGGMPSWGSPIASYIDIKGVLVTDLR